MQWGHHCEFYHNRDRAKIPGNWEMWIYFFALGEGFKNEITFNIAYRTEKRMYRHGDMIGHWLFRELCKPLCHCYKV